ncbi:MAG: hypothetical protein ACRENE_28155, partial [Polyangiaceae bacterium]
SALSFILPAPASAVTYASVHVQFAEFDATCNSPAGESGMGTVDLTGVGAGSLKGTFSFSLNGDTITGNFDAPTCDVPTTPTASTCK